MIRSPEYREAKATVRRLEAGERKARKAEALKRAKVEIASIMANGKDRRKREPKFLAYIRRQPCEAAHRGGCFGRIEAAHIRYSDGPGRINPGMGNLNHDHHANPLCHGHHQHDQHRRNERAFWDRLGKDAYATAAAHYAAYKGADHG